MESFIRTVCQKTTQSFLKHACAIESTDTGVSDVVPCKPHINVMAKMNA